MPHTVEFSVPFSALEDFARKYAEDQNIQVGDKGNFSFRIERDERVGFVSNRKETALGVRFESK